MHLTLPTSVFELFKVRAYWPNGKLVECDNLLKYSGRIPFINNIHARFWLCSCSVEEFQSIYMKKSLQIMMFQYFILKNTFKVWIWHY